MTDETAKILRDLARVASGELTHRYETGRCPDSVEGPDTRDPLCAACKVLMRYDALELDD